MLSFSVLILFFMIGFSCAGYGYKSYNSEFVGQEVSKSEEQAVDYVPNYTKTSQSKSSYRKNYGTKSKSYENGAKSYGGGGQKSYTGSKTWGSNYGHTNTITDQGSLYQEFSQNSNMPYEPKCKPECKNNGICVDKDTCHCPQNYYGTYCEFEKKPCLTYPPLPMNSIRKCSADLCTITCSPGHKFLDGTTVANMRCIEGQWRPTRADLTSLPDCEPQCHPPCLNGGVCLSVNTCQCPNDYRGEQCQYATSVCDVRKLSFNGGYKCKGDMVQFSCSLNCPVGSQFSEEPAETYTCLYSTGKFTPTPIPHCRFNDVLIVTPSYYEKSGYSSMYYETHWKNQTSAAGSYNQNIAYGGSSGHAVRNPMQVVVQDLTPKGGTCIAWAHSHYKTFDGQVYSFTSKCEHILLRDTKDDKFTIAVKQGVCEKGPCSSVLDIYIEEKEYVLSIDDHGAVSFSSVRRRLPVPLSLPGLRLRLVNQGVEVALDSVGVILHWDLKNVIVVEASVQLWNNTAGLCGVMDGNPITDFTCKDKSVAKSVSAFASSWQMKKVGEKCDDTPNEINSCSSADENVQKNANKFCTEIFTRKQFKKCSFVMDSSLLMEACVMDFCSCKNKNKPEECACETVSVFARECLRHGVEEVRIWRDQNTCPMKCAEGLVYSECGPDEQPTCAFPKGSNQANASKCFEGCFCPKGLLLEGDKCIKKEECPCRLRNKEFAPGSVVSKECNTCTCEVGEWRCSSIPCGSRCAVVGDPHYVTFDGLAFDFMGHCTYHLLKTEHLDVQVENVACSGAISEAMNLAPHTGEGQPSCTKAVIIKYKDVSVYLKEGGFMMANEKELSVLPAIVGNVLIRAASSMFVIVQFPNGVDLWWDGNTRVFVDVPPSFNNKTQGLCGTFNLNQKDDFLTPEGDIEQSSLAFANKWKSQELCSDVIVSDPEHPCKANMQNKDAAEKYCGKLKSALFEDCQWHVDVSQYYEWCLYDMCACETDISRCLCPVIGDYAMACATQGVFVQWRYSVKECEVSCTGGQEYTVCADSCQRTCQDLSLKEKRKCKPTCVEGCACAAGQLLDESGACVAVSECPCYHKGMKFNPGYKEVRPGRRERELCTCIGASWDCVPATDSDVQNYPAAEDLQHNCSSKANMEFTACRPKDTLTCKNMHLPQSASSIDCEPGCQCKKGLVLETKSGKCLAPEQCPCHHGGRSYPDGHSMQEECNTCVCKSGSWSCSDKPCSGVCSSWGDSHISSFDGSEFDFEGVCSYLLAKGTMGQDKEGFSVEIQNVPCGTTGATCSKSITLKVGKDGDEEIATLAHHHETDYGNLKKIKVRLAGVYIFLDVPSLGISLQWDKATRVYVRVDAMWKNRVKGLCGNYNMDQRDDYQTPSGGGIAESSALLFVDSWKLKSTCPKALPVKDHCQQRPERKDWAVSTCALIKKLPFSLCHTEVPPEKFISRCESDACACDGGEDCVCVCAALAHYAALCNSRGVSFKWRNNELCPMQCDMEGSHYDPCMDACPLETCDNTINYKDIKATCSKDNCIEGCKPKKLCPEGSVYTNSTYNECVPRSKCRPLCLLPDGRQVLEGEVVEQDLCHTCRCSKGEKICSGQPCTTLPPILVMTSPKSHDEPLKCVSGWSPWLNKAEPENNTKGESQEIEHLPKYTDFQHGEPMCDIHLMKKIECRTAIDHKSPKETGLNVECSLEKGLICNEPSTKCPDFEVRVYCECDHEPDTFQCLDATRPSRPHPTDCRLFLECTPDLLNQNKPHTVVKSCGEGMMYNPEAMVCDWPDSVINIRPECANKTDSVGQYLTTIPPSILTWATATIPTTTVKSCPVNHTYSECAYPCDKLCDHFKNSVMAKGLCQHGKQCIAGCMEDSLYNTKCDFGSYWRDTKTCVPMSDCTCDFNGDIVKPHETRSDRCLKCQCLDNVLHCDSTECVSINVPTQGFTHESLKFTEPETTVVTTPSTTTTTTKKLTTMKTTTVDATTPTTTKKIPTTTTTKKIPKTTKTIPITTKTTPTTTKKIPTTTKNIPKTTKAIPITTKTTPATTKITPNTTKTTPTTTKTTPTATKTTQTATKTISSKKKISKATKAIPITTINTPTTTKKIPKTMKAIPITTKTTPTTTTAIPIATTTESIIVVKSTLTPPPLCTYGYKHILWSDDSVPESSFTASSIKDYFEPQFAELNVHPTDLNGGSWNPASQDTNQFIQVELPHREPIHGVLLQGSPLYDQYVTSYEVLYGDDGIMFSTVQDKDGRDLVLRGPTDHENTMKQLFPSPIEAKFIRIHPLTWHNEISIRFELIGCAQPDVSTEDTIVTTTVIPPMMCSDEIGIHSGLPLDNIEVSSNNEDIEHLDLDSERGWRPLYSTPGEWIMFDFTSPRNITGIKTKGGAKGWVTTYNIKYATDLKTFNFVVDDKKQNKIFAGNFNGDFLVSNEFHPPINARYLKLVPLTWKDNIEMRVEPIGCFLPYPTEPTIRKSVPPKSPCLCPGAQPSSNGSCLCPEGNLYDGEDCVTRDQCPCFVAFISYDVGAKFRGENCDECVCKLGGVPHCKPVKQCQCEQNLLPKISSTCECVCEPCPNNTKLCPTSKVCLSLDKWCDGLQDCADDEVDCVSTTTAQTSTVAPNEKISCPKVECPPDYKVVYTSKNKPLARTKSLPRMSKYQKYFKGNNVKSAAKGGRKGFVKAPTPPSQNNAFSLSKPKMSAPSISPSPSCSSFSCVPALKKKSSRKKQDCSVPRCPNQFKLEIQSTKDKGDCPQYSCVPPPEKPSYCELIGRTFTTFDGAQYKYDICYHILARDNKHDDWTIYVRKKCRVEGCSTELIVRQDDQTIVVRPTLIIEYDNYEYTVEQTNMICFQKNSFDVDRLGTGLSLKSRRYNFTVLYNTYGDVKVGVSKSYMGSVDGLCGAFDGSMSNDRQSPDGSKANNVEQFGDSWAKPGLDKDACKTTLIPPDVQRKVWNMCASVVEEPLKKCGSVLNLDKWRSICLEKICECADLVVNGTKKTYEQCKCLLLEQFVAECLAGDKGMQLDGWRVDNQCPASCPAPLVHQSCFSLSCEPTCSPTARTCSESADCVSGCYCPQGTLRKGDDCILPADCNDCVCNIQNGPIKFSTFDHGNLPFEDDCTHLVSQNRNAKGDHKYQVYITNGPCTENKKTICIKTIHLLYENNIIRFEKDSSNKHQMTVNNNMVYKHPLVHNWIETRIENGQELIAVLTEAHVELRIKESSMDFSISLPSYVYGNTTEGLCGVCDGDQDKLIKMDGLATDSLEEYTKSWHVKGEILEKLKVEQTTCEETVKQPECIPPPPEKNPCYNLYNQEKFGACHPLVNPESYIESCNMAMCGNQTQICQVLERYADECRQKGVCLNWRKGLCDYQCDQPLVYRHCLDCELTCDNHDEFIKYRKKCDKTPVEGCFCPRGLVRVNNTCIEPSKCFPCDANKEHYAGDEWKENACTKCSCSRLRDENVAHVSCVSETCITPVCKQDEDIVAIDKKPDQCCQQYDCVPKKLNAATCLKPKKIKCGYGQVLKQKSSNGCIKYTCECIPASECKPIKSPSEVEVLDHGMVRLVDNSGCCPKMSLVCDKSKCPKAPVCKDYEVKVQKNFTCCEQYSCELPKDKCVVKLEWEASPEGGEKPRNDSEIVVKDIDAVWLDGPCRTCSCSPSATSSCVSFECPSLKRDGYIVEGNAVPFACCPLPKYVACLDGDDLYEIGEYWQSKDDVCKSYHCAEMDDGKFEKITHVQYCDTNCPAGYNYTKKDASKCCGECEPNACIVNGEIHSIGEHWFSDDHCLQYNCQEYNGSLQVQSKNESCPQLSDENKKQYVYKEISNDGQCCKKFKPIACRVDNVIYQEGQSWSTPDPCVNMTCSLSSEGLTITPQSQACEACPLGYKFQSVEGTCCGKCIPSTCMVDGQEKSVGSTWHSADNCTLYSCDVVSDSILVSATYTTCPNVENCDPKYLVNETCCTVCKEKPLAHQSCYPSPLPASQTVNLIRLKIGSHGYCVNKDPIKMFKECRGSCISGTVYNNQTGIHDSNCECCQVTHYQRLKIELSCEDGSKHDHTVASPDVCSCRACGNTLSVGHGNSSKKPNFENEEDFLVPDIFKRNDVKT